MYIATHELIIPSTIVEIEQRATRAQHAMPARPARWSPVRWLRARRAAGTA
jgi:hypothetical protein